MHLYTCLHTDTLQYTFVYGLHDKNNAIVYRLVKIGVTIDFADKVTLDSFLEYYEINIAKASSAKLSITAALRQKKR